MATSGPIAIAFPRAEPIRALYRRLVDQPLPAIVPESVDEPCHRCGVILAVGPRMAQRMDAEHLPVYCLFCCAEAAGDGQGLARAHFESLNNPDSKFEEPAERHSVLVPAAHRICAGAICEIWFHGTFIGEVTADEGPGVRVISKYAMAAWAEQHESPGVVTVQIRVDDPSARSGS